jgi:uncharacterized ParB-like nuclease family protein
MNNIQLINVDRLAISSATQVRTKLCNATISHYSERMDAGDQFPPVVVFQNGDGTYAIGDGFHRIKAAALSKRKQIEAVVHMGNHKDALDYALRANLTHGNRLTNADKRKAVLMALDAWPEESDRAIARRCGVSDPTVGKYRREQVLNFSTPPQVVGIPCSVVTPSSTYADPEPPKPASPKLAPPPKPPSPLKGKPRVRKARETLAEEEQKKVAETQSKINALSPAARRALLKWMKALIK